MALDLLGEGFDLHGAGDDLVFPHHENERVQAEGAGQPVRAPLGARRAWSTKGGEKMAKSVGNFTTIADALDTYGADVPARRPSRDYHRSTELGAKELEAAATGVGRLRRAHPACGRERHRCERRTARHRDR